MIRQADDRKMEVRDRMREGPGSVTIRHFFEKSDFTAPVRLCAQLTLPAGAGIGMHTHTGEDEIYIVTRGSGLLDDGKQKSRVKAGDSVLTGKGASHAITNEGNEPLELIAVIACYPDAHA